jgi:chaperonin GroES
MAIKPLSDRVVLKRVDAAETVKGGIIIPDTAKEKPMEAEVVAVGKARSTRMAPAIPCPSRPARRC